jgi:hypothetical protein
MSHRTLTLDLLLLFVLAVMAIITEGVYFA